MLNQLRYVEYTDDGCSLWECLACYERVEMRGQPGDFCTFCGTCWDAIMKPPGNVWPTRNRDLVPWDREKLAAGFVLESKSELFAEEGYPGKWCQARVMDTQDAHAAYRGLLESRRVYQNDPDTTFRVTWKTYYYLQDGCRNGD